MTRVTGSAVRIFALSAMFLVGFFQVQAQLKNQVSPPDNTHVRNVPLAPAEIDRIIRTFSAKETEFRKALNNYAFRRDAEIQTVSQLGGQITGSYHRVSNFVFDDSGKRYERVTFFPEPTLTEIQVTNEDLEDLGGIQPYALEASKINQYNFSYVGKEKIDELDLYVFDVAPKSMDEKNVSQRFFKGRIWVDDRDLMIVKVRGKGVPEGKQRFPTFETYREQIDGKHWFPTYTHSDDELVFGNGQTVHEQMTVRYTDYKETHATVRIIDDNNNVIDDTDKKPAPTDTSPQPPPPAKKP